MSGPIISKESDLKILSKIVEHLVQDCEIGRSRTFLEMKDVNGRAFRYISLKERANQNSGRVEQSSKMDEIFHQMIGRSSDKDTSGTRHHGYLEDDEDSQDEASEDHSIREDQA